MSANRQCTLGLIRILILYNSGKAVGKIILHLADELSLLSPEMFCVYMFLYALLKKKDSLSVSSLSACLIGLLFYIKQLEP
jgi:hypothetical protein